MRNDYPVDYEVSRPVAARNRLTVFFRPILAIPHLILVGGPAMSVGIHAGSSNGVLGVVAVICAIVNWFAIVFTGRAIQGLGDLQEFYLRWRANALAYTAILRDEYPPFSGDLPYSGVAFELAPPVLGDRNRWTVGLRLILAIPQLIVFAILTIAAIVVAVIAWFAILFTGSYPESLRTFTVDVLRWGLRLESYLLLLHDQYPPFALGGGANPVVIAPGPAAT
jgi:hypothetical protein